MKKVYDLTILDIPVRIKTLSQFSLWLAKQLGKKTNVQSHWGINTSKERDYIDRNSK